jgi:penicillin-binding protein 1C
LARPLEVLPVAAAALLLAVFFFVGPPYPHFAGGRSTVLYDASGELLGASVSETGLWKFAAGHGLPPKFRDALVTFEDRRFWSHPGFDARALVRALVENSRAGGVVSGGSTLSMQAARLALAPGARTLWRKGVEAWLALRFEFLLGKEGLLDLYAANAPFGGNVVGLDAASFRYFGRPPQGLSWAEAATLAVLPNAPSEAHPGKNRAGLLAKRDRLLRTLRDRGFLDEEDLGLALAEPLPDAPYDLPRLAPWLLDRAAVEGGKGGRIATTLDARLQERVTDIVERHRDALAGNGIYNAACLVARVDSGEVLAYVGNAGLQDPADHGQSVDLVRARRSPGSILKPFLYAAMLGSGELTPRMLVADIPTRMGSYSPENFTETYSGAVPASEALARSLNVPFVRLLRSYGLQRFLDLLRSTGVATLDRGAEDYGLTLILGGGEVSLWDMAGRYAALARTAQGLGARRGGGGQHFDLAWTPSAAAGRPARRDPFSRGAAWLTLDALLSVARPGEEASWQEYASARKIAWKTGTSFGLRDAWAIGVTADYVVAVWVGNASGEGRPDLRGSAAAAPILFDVFGGLPASPWPARPDSDLASVTLCADSGYPAGPDCARTVRVLLPAEARPDQACPWCRLVQLSADGAWRVTADSERLDLMRTVKRFVLPPAMEWYYRQSHLDYRPLPPWKPGAGPRPGTRGQSPLAIVAPDLGAAIYVPVELSGRPGATVFSAVHQDPHAMIYWHLDGDYLGSTSGEHRMAAHPGPGSHILSIVDDAGNEAERSFEVLSER